MLVPKKVIAALVAAASAGQQETLSRITHCVDCNEKISKSMRYRQGNKRCRQCHYRFEKQKQKQNSMKPNNNTQKEEKNDEMEMV